WKGRAAVDEYVVKQGKKLKKGYTTGSCAAAAAKSAAMILLGGKKIDSVRLETPSGKTLFLPIADCIETRKNVCCTVIKDAGDDPDVTNGIQISAVVCKIDSGIRICGGKGVGIVTKRGLQCKVGEPAINPVPQKMIRESVQQVMDEYHYMGGLEISILAENGEKIAEQTFNPRLGIMGGISILGTSGIVEPMSERALVETIQTEMDSILADGTKDLLICPGNYGRDFAKEKLGLSLENAVKCSNFIGEALDYAAYRQVENILLIGHAGKLSKLAAGIMNTHSRVADCRSEIFAAHAALAGADSLLIREIMEAPTTGEIHRLLTDAGIESTVWKSVLEKILFYVNHRVQGRCRIEAVLFLDENKIVCQSKGSAEWIKRMIGKR
ncbi:MAG: cobalt-precorrin-5B (C(1))-methyltransferase CbiD, partial [Oscillospiraceae bacterium]